MSSKSSNGAALESEVPLLGAEKRAEAGETPAVGAGARRTADRKDDPPTYSEAARDRSVNHAKESSDQLAFSHLSNLKNGVAGGSLGDESSGLGLETPTASGGSAEDFSATPSSEGDEDGDANEKTPLHSPNGRSVTIVTTRSKPEAEDGSPMQEKGRSAREGSCVSFRSNASSSSCQSSSTGHYSGDLEAAPPKKRKHTVPDGGWGWMVVLSSFIISMIADGISFSFGLLLLSFLDHFQDSTSKTSWIGSLFMSVPLMAGPIGSALVDRYGCRKMTMLGGIISASGFILSSMSNSVEMQMVTFGVIAGLGLGLTYVTCVVSIAFWFDKRRALANGVGAAGTGFGTFVFAPMTNYFITNYGWRGAILLLAGTFLNMCVCGAVMRDPEWWVEEQAALAKAAAQADGRSVSNKSRGGSSCAGSLAALSDGAAEAAATAELEEARRLLKQGRSPEEVLATLLASARLPVANGAAPNGVPPKAPACSSVLNLPTFLRQDETVPVEVLEKLYHNRRVLIAVLDKYPSLLPSRSLSDDGKLAAFLPNLPLPAPGERLKTTSPAAAMAPLAVPDTPLTPRSATPPVATPALTPTPAPALTRATRPTPPPAALPLAAHPSLAAQAPLPTLKSALCGVAQPSHYLKGIRVHRNSVMYRGAMLNIHKYKLRASSCPNIFRNSMTTIAQEEEEHWYTEVLSVLKSMADFSLFCELHFLLLQLSTTLLFIWFIVPYFYLADFMTSNGFSDTEASLLLSCIGITNTIGILGLGWAGDQPWVNVTKCYAGCLVICGLSAIMMVPCVGNFYALATSAAIFGLFFASCFSFTPIILVQLVPMDKFTSAYGLVLLCQGIGNLIGPPLAGWLYDIMKSWSPAFYLTGFWIVISGLLIGAIPMTKNHRLFGCGLQEKDKDMEEYLQKAIADQLPPVLKGIV